MPLRFRGRPRDPLAAIVRLQVEQRLQDLGPGVGLPTLRGLFPAVPRSRLCELQSAHRKEWYEANSLVTEQLTWTRPGAVWVADFTGPPSPVDGCFRYVLAVRDLGSSMQLLSLPVRSKDTHTAVSALEELFLSHGAPLVLKSDNDGAFVSGAFQDLLERCSVVPLLSPAALPRYNGAVEAGIGSLKTRASHEAARNGRAGHWTCDDVEAARLQANRTARPWGPRGPTPREVWDRRQPITAKDRETFRQCVAEMESQVRTQLGCGLSGSSELAEGRGPESLDGAAEAAVARAAVRRALQMLGHLAVRRRRIAPPFHSKLRYKIT